ncbi:hypothetical protein [Streptomyces sp. NPDC048419]|uniref:hypothetical protein n=1 Tax=Streptomyces sp. NPDC048419 TaxID=3365547 RepID=UPI003714EF26
MSATSIPTEMDLNGKITKRVSGGTWEMDESGAEQQLDVTLRDEKPRSTCTGTRGIWW